jgi:hypothetical protein
LVILHVPALASLLIADIAEGLAMLVLTALIAEFEVK